MCDMVISKIASERLQREEREIKVNIDRCGQEEALSFFHLICMLCLEHSYEKSSFLLRGDHVFVTFLLGSHIAVY